MSECKKCRSLLLEAFYKELNPEQSRFFEDHIQNCPRCKSRFDEMSSTLQFMSKRIRPEPGKSFWDSYEERLAHRIEKEERVQLEGEPKPRKLVRAFYLAPRWAYQTAAAVILIVAGIFIGRMIFQPSVSQMQQASQQTPLISQQQPEIQLTSRAHSYIQRSKLILLALVNFDPATEDPYALDLPNQQQISRQLVQEAGLLKRDLAASDQKRLQDLITNLEVILLQIANLESENDFETIELLKDGVDRKGVLMEINLTDLRRSMNQSKKAESQKKPSSQPNVF